MAIVKGNVKWCSIQQPNTTFDPVWQVDVLITDKAVEKELKASGLKLKKDKDGDTILKISRNVFRADGTENKAPVCVSANAKVPFTELVGNGSLCNVQYACYEWKNKFGSGVSADLKGVQVLEHVSYDKPDGSEFEDEAGAEEALAPKTEEAAEKDGGEFDDDIPF